MTDSKGKKTIPKVRKSNRKDAFDNNRELMRFASASSRDAIKRAWASGVVVHYMKDGKLIQEGPDQEARVIKDSKKEPFDLREYLCQG